MDQKFKIGGTISSGNSYLEFLFRQFKVVRLHAILHDAAGAVRAHNGKGPGYCYMLGRKPKSCLLGHLTGLLFCHYIKLFLPSIFKKNWEFSFWWQSSAIPNLSSKKLQTHKTSVLVHKKLAGNCMEEWTFGLQ